MKAKTFVMYPLLRCGRVLGTILDGMDVLPLGTYDGMYLESLECSTYGTVDGNFESLLM